MLTPEKDAEAFFDVLYFVGFWFLPFPKNGFQFVAIWNPALPIVNRFIPEFHRFVQNFVTAVIGYLARAFDAHIFSAFVHIALTFNAVNTPG